jgi:hypothetical protein
MCVYRVVSPKMIGEPEILLVDSRVDSIVCSELQRSPIGCEQRDEALPPCRSFTPTPRSEIQKDGWMLNLLSQTGCSHV